MKSKPTLISAAIIVVGLILGYFILDRDKPEPVGEHGHGGGSGHGESGRKEKPGEGHEEEHGESHAEGQEEEAERGPHRGRLFRDREFALELTIFETGVDPQFRAYLFENGKPLRPEGTRLQVELHRLGGPVDTIGFSGQGEFLLGGKTVEEPHSFEVRIRVERAGKVRQWEYSQVEGRVGMDPESMQASGIEVETAGSALMKSTLSLNGKIMPNEDRLAHIFARFPGVVKEVRKHLGEPVKKGEVLAIVESNESLEAYNIVSQIDGTVIRKHVTAGETVGAEEELFAITDLNSVWADFSVYRHDFSRLRKGQRVIVDAGDGTETVASALAYLSPIGAEHTQTMTARASVPNRTGQWPPGLFVKGRVILSEFRVPVAIRAEALQTFRDWDVVFVNVGEVFEARPLELGRRDGDWVEVVSGLAAGQKYVTRNSYVIKADIGKAGASHDH